MFDIIKSYFDKEEYYLIVSPNFIYIKNYEKIINITKSEVLLEINKKIYKITGTNFSLVKSIDREVKINGNIEGINKL